MLEVNAIQGHLIWRAFNNSCLGIFDINFEKNVGHLASYKFGCIRAFYDSSHSPWNNTAFLPAFLSHVLKATFCRRRNHRSSCQLIKLIIYCTLASPNQPNQLISVFLHHTRKNVNSLLVMIVRQAWLLCSDNLTQVYFNLIRVWTTNFLPHPLTFSTRTTESKTWCVLLFSIRKCRNFALSVPTAKVTLTSR